MKTKLSYIPYHDWRKIILEGNRTRDAHFIQSFRESNEIETLLIINRPITFLELLVKKKSVSTKLKYKVLHKNGNGVLYQLDDKTYLVDFILFENVKQFLKGRKWFFDAYDNDYFKCFVQECQTILELRDSGIISANIFSHKLFSNFSNKVVFDAWDNFYLMPGLKSLKEDLLLAYNNMAKISSKWVTNSLQNKNFYKKKYDVDNIEIIKNGVGLNVFSKKNKTPKDLEYIKNKGSIIVGFGGKITHLFDFELFNFVTHKNLNIEFVIIGQILDKDVFSKIILRENVSYLGDKHYEVYPDYITNFDIGIVPYRIGEGQHGGDSIKAYEYLAASLKVVGTRGNGLESLEKYINIADTKEEFSEYIQNGLDKIAFPIADFSWEEKTKYLIKIINQ